MTHEERIKKVYVAFPMFAEMLLGRSKGPRWTDAPDDAVVVGFHQEPYIYAGDLERSKIYFVVWSDTFDPLPAGQELEIVVFSFSNADECPEGMREIGVLP